MNIRKLALCIPMALAINVSLASPQVKSINIWGVTTHHTQAGASAFIDNTVKFTSVLQVNPDGYSLKIADIDITGKSTPVMAGNDCYLSKFSAATVSIIPYINGPASINQATLSNPQAKINKFKTCLEQADIAQVPYLAIDFENAQGLAYSQSANTFYQTLSNAFDKKPVYLAVNTGQIPDILKAYPQGTPRNFNLLVMAYANANNIDQLIKSGIPFRIMLNASSNNEKTEKTTKAILLQLQSYQVRSAANFKGVNFYHVNDIPTTSYHPPMAPTTASLFKVFINGGTIT